MSDQFNNDGNGNDNFNGNGSFDGNAAIDFAHKVFDPLSPEFINNQLQDHRNETLALANKLLHYSHLSPADENQDTLQLQNMIVNNTNWAEQLDAIIGALESHQVGANDIDPNNAPRLDLENFHGALFRGSHASNQLYLADDHSSVLLKPHFGDALLIPNTEPDFYFLLYGNSSRYWTHDQKKQYYDGTGKGYDRTAEMWAQQGKNIDDILIVSSGVSGGEVSAYVTSLINMMAAAASSGSAMDISALDHVPDGQIYYPDTSVTPGGHLSSFGNHSSNSSIIDNVSLFEDTTSSLTNAMSPAEREAFLAANAPGGSTIDTRSIPYEQGVLTDGHGGFFIFSPNAIQATDGDGNYLTRTNPDGSISQIKTSYQTFRNADTGQLMVHAEGSGFIFNGHVTAEGKVVGIVEAENLGTSSGRYQTWVFPAEMLPDGRLLATVAPASQNNEDLNGHMMGENNQDSNSTGNESHHSLSAAQISALDALNTTFVDPAGENGPVTRGIGSVIPQSVIQAMANGMGPAEAALSSYIKNSSLTLKELQTLYSACSRLAGAGNISLGYMADLRGLLISRGAQAGFISLPMLGVINAATAGWMVGTSIYNNFSSEIQNGLSRIFGNPQAAAEAFLNSAPPTSTLSGNGG